MKPKQTKQREFVSDSPRAGTSKDPTDEFIAIPLESDPDAEKDKRKLKSLMKKARPLMKPKQTKQRECVSDSESEPGIIKKEPIEPKTERHSPRAGTSKDPKDEFIVIPSESEPDVEKPKKKFAVVFSLSR